MTVIVQKKKTLLNMGVARGDNGAETTALQLNNATSLFLIITVTVLLPKI